jgi:hypothetical protein
MLADVHVKVWIAHVRTLRCPSCGEGPKRIALQEWRKSVKPLDAVKPEPEEK